MIANVYKDKWSKIGGGVRNYLSYGDYPVFDLGEVESYKIPRGIVLDRDLSKVHPVDANSPEESRSTFIIHGINTRKETKPVCIPTRERPIWNILALVPPISYWT